MMTIVRRPSPARELLSLRSAMDRLFEDSFVRPGRWNGLIDDAVSVPLDVSTSTDAVVVEASLPGYRPNDVEITVEGDTLTLAGHIDQESEQRDGSYVVQEIRRGSFTRTLTLPDGVDADRAEASFENGILTLRIPRVPAARPRLIRITSATDGTHTASPSTDPAREPAKAEA
jgi:HSP20 family protein